MLPEITDFARPLALVAAGLALAVLVTAVRVPVPAPALFLPGQLGLSQRGDWSCRGTFCQPLLMSQRDRAGGSP